MIDTKFLDQLKRFNLIIQKRVTSSLAGQRRSIAKGRGLIFSDHRIYSPGDDFRTIDWKVYARTDNLYIKNYEEERNVTVHIILDVSKSMDFNTKFDYASMIGVGFAYLAAKSNEKVHFATFADDINVFQSYRGMTQLMAIVKYLNEIKPKGISNIDEAFTIYKKYLGTRAMIIIISDFLINIEKIKHALHLLGKHDIKVIQVLDPVEKSFRLEGDFELKDSETNDKMKTNISPMLRMQYQKLLENHVAEIQKTCRSLGVSFYQITTDTPIFDAFYRIVGKQ